MDTVIISPRAAKPNTDHRITLMLMLIILAGMGLLAYLLRSSYQNEVLSASSSLLVLAPTPTPIIKRPDWNIFSNTQFGYSIQYPPGIKPMINPPSDVYLHFVTFTAIPKDEDDAIKPDDMFSLTVRKDSLENEVALQRSRVEGHIPVIYQGQRQITILGKPAIRLDYAPESSSTKPLSLVSVNRPPVVFTLYFPNTTDASLADQILETLLFL